MARLRCDQHRHGPLACPRAKRFDQKSRSYEVDLPDPRPSRHRRRQPGRVDQGCQLTHGSCSICKRLDLAGIGDVARLPSRFDAVPRERVARTAEPRLIYLCQEQSMSRRQRPSTSDSHRPRPACDHRY